ncbi:hypothetical protein B9Z19DRAFT_259431 [Tuber borchii]|uniref:Uncharacterized protein n=1 Tax=Tuber borchii TaxID=42251 RepID=A0A2T6ZLE5_TUBBO|nr:hypothetical protein B9Z19DRAFT_259431 [Tuber borchii]
MFYPPDTTGDRLFSLGGSGGVEGLCIGMSRSWLVAGGRVLEWNSGKRGGRQGHFKDSDAGFYRWIEVSLLRVRDAGGLLRVICLKWTCWILGCRIPRSEIARISASPLSGGPRNGGVGTILDKYVGPTLKISVSATSRWVGLFFGSLDVRESRDRAWVDIRVGMSWHQLDRHFRYISLASPGLTLLPWLLKWILIRSDFMRYRILLIPSYAQMVKRVLRATALDTPRNIPPSGIYSSTSPSSQPTTPV